MNPAPSINPELALARRHLRESGVLIIIDDEAQIGEVITKLLGKSVGTIKHFEIYGDLLGKGDAPEKIINFKSLLREFISEELGGVIPNLCLLDRQLHIRRLNPANPDDDNDGPLLIPSITEEIPGIKIIGCTAEGEEPGVANLYPGSIVTKSKLNTIAAIQALIDKLALIHAGKSD